VSVTTSNVRAFSIGQVAKDALTAYVNGQPVEVSGKGNVELSDGVWQVRFCVIDD
jgi:hypothetical protein